MIAVISTCFVSFAPKLLELEFVTDLTLNAEAKLGNCLSTVQGFCRPNSASR